LLEDELIPEKISSTRKKINLAATRVLIDASKVEKRLFEVFKETVDCCMGRADYECLTDIADDLSSLVSYSETLMTTALLDFPESVKRRAYAESFHHVTPSLLQSLPTDPIAISP